MAEFVPVEIAMLGAAGTVVYTNERWRTLGLGNGLVGAVNGLDEDYLDVLRDGPEDTGTEKAHDGILAILDGDD